MEFATFADARSMLLWSTFAIAFVMGAVVNKTNFCTMGAVSDIVNIGDSGRMRSWLFAIAIAILGVVVLSLTGLVNVKQAFPPYTGSMLIWAENILGGFLFGIGMTLASGCGNKCLIRIGGGNLKSVMVFVVIAVIAYFMMYPFPGTDQTLMSVIFFDWIRPLAINLKTGQDLGSVIAGAECGHRECGDRNSAGTGLVGVRLQIGRFPQIRQYPGRFGGRGRGTGWLVHQLQSSHRS